MKTRASQAGMTLMEITVALFIFSLGLLGLMEAHLGALKCSRMAYHSTLAVLKRSNERESQ